MISCLSAAIALGMLVYPIDPRGYDAAVAQWPNEITLTISFLGARDNSLTIGPGDPVRLAFEFANATASPQTVRIMDCDPYHGALPYPVGLAVRTEYADGTIHPTAKDNGGWWSQYMCWSTLFLDSERTEYTLQPHKTHRIIVDLEDVLAVPAGGPPPDWPINLARRYRPGEYSLRFRYEGWTSQELHLTVTPD